MTKLRDILSSRIPGLSDSSWSVRDDQPLCLEALHKISLFMQDPDTELFPSLLAGVSTGFDGEIPPSNVFHIKDTNADSSSNFRPDLSIHLENWKSAEDRPDVVDELVEDELQKGWIYKFDGSVEEAKTAFPMGLAIGKLGLAITDSRPPRLVVDSTVCGTNGNCIINEHQCMPSAKDVLRTFPLRNNRHELSALGLDVRAAHKRVVIKESHRGLLGFSHRNSLYFYKVAPFGAVFSAHWWGRLGSFWVRFLHQAIFVAHALFLFVDDFLLIQRKDVLPLTAAFVCSLMQVFGLPISWRKADLHCALDWIGWRFNFGIGAIYLQERKRSKLLELISQMLSHPRIAKKTLEKFLGLALWITQIFPQMRSSLHYLFSDLHRPPGTQYSVDPGYWPITISCLTDTLQFSTRPAGTAIPAGSKLISVRHQPVKTLTDVHNARLTEKRIWVRVMDPTSSRRKTFLRIANGYSRPMNTGCNTLHLSDRFILSRTGLVRLLQTLALLVQCVKLVDILSHLLADSHGSHNDGLQRIFHLWVSQSRKTCNAISPAMKHWHSWLYCLWLLACGHHDVSMCVFLLGAIIQVQNPG